VKHFAYFAVKNQTAKGARNRKDLKMNIPERMSELEKIYPQIFRLYIFTNFAHRCNLFLVDAKLQFQGKVKRKIALLSR
jgi:hypothetical protein